MKLPVRLGGLGLLSREEHIDAAYVSLVNKSAKLVKSLYKITNYNPAKITSLAFNNLKSISSEFNNLKEKSLTNQKLLSSLIDINQHQKWLEENDDRNKARINSLSFKHPSS